MSWVLGVVIGVVWKVLVIVWREVWEEVWDCDMDGVLCNCVCVSFMIGSRGLCGGFGNKLGGWII